MYTTADGKEIELPQELCDIFNDIVTQAVIPYFADALIAAGIGDTTNLTVENEVLQRDVDNLTRTLEEGAEEYEAEKHRAEVAERALDKACADVEQLTDCCRWAANGGVITIEEYTPEKATPQAYIDRAEKELTEEE